VNIQGSSGPKPELTQQHSRMSRKASEEHKEHTSRFHMKLAKLFLNPYHLLEEAAF
jgi:hypothetical protein